MRRRHFLLTPALAAGLPAQTARPRLPRRDCFFGIHFDLHPNPRDTALGRDVTDEMIERFLTAVKPDYVQYDCKGHVGWLGYPSKVSTSAPGIVKDSLDLWRKATARHGVGLFIHFSGVWDTLAITENPRFATIGPDGKMDPNNTSVWSDYVDQRMIPQLKEAAEKYDLDGAWVDGECWAVKPDFSEAAWRAWGKELPHKPSGPGWNEYLEFQRERFRQYVKHYIDALHLHRPRFQIASNWLYSTFVPERPTLPVDFLSGDYLGNAPISRARLEARYLGATGKPWDLMAWGFQSFRTGLGHVHKPAVQLMQEAGVVLAQGGGFQVYYAPTRAGHIDSKHIGVMAKVASFCRARQALCHKSEPVPQVGVLFSKHSLYRTSNKMFGGWGALADPAAGLIDALIENHYSVDVIPDWKLAEDAARYPMIAVPDWPDTGEDARAALVRYAEAGGKLLLVGAQNGALFTGSLGVKTMRNPEEQAAYLDGGELFANMKGLWLDVEMKDAKLLLERYPTHDPTRDGKPAATLHTLGKGRVAAIFGPAGTVFARTHAAPLRHAIGRVASALYTPDLAVEGPPTVESALRRKGGRTMVHLLNMTGMQVSETHTAMDFVPPVGPLRVSLRLPAAPRRVTLQPAGTVVKGEWKGGAWSGVVPRLEFHEALVFE